MKRIVFWALSTLSATVLLFGYSTSTSGPLAATTSATSVISGATSGQAASPSATPSTSGSAPPTDSTSGSSATGSSDTGSSDTDPGTTSSGTAGSSTVTGSVAQTRWGPVQVELTLDGTTISDVSVLQYPNGNGRDAEINNVALPRLISETIDAQSADIDMVSGATYTSQGYLESLQSALDQAGA